MTSPQNEILLTIVMHEDVHLATVKLREGWGDAYQKKAAVVRLSRSDIEKLGLKDGVRVEISTAAGSVVVVARADSAGEAGVGLMPSSLYTNRLAGYDPGALVPPGKHIEARAVPTEEPITPLSDMKVRRNRA
jgi:formylmethanofuran dehydrogenase subunit D